MINGFKKSLIEVLVIVFSVLLATWLENLRQHGEDQETAKEFLLGLKEDLKKDISEMRADKASYLKCKQGFLYFSNLTEDSIWIQDSIDNYRYIFYNRIALVPNDGAYEGFKSSGKLYSIQNRELRAAILDLYQESIPLLLNSTNLYIAKKEKITTYFEDQQQFGLNGESNFKSIILSPKMKNLCQGLSYMDEILARYDQSIDISNKIVSLIDAEYEK